MARQLLNLVAHMTTIPKNSIKFSAEAAFGHTEQFIARVTGPDSRFGVALEFLGHKNGKRGELTTVTIVDSGLYEVIRPTSRSARPRRSMPSGTTRTAI